MNDYISNLIENIKKTENLKSVGLIETHISWVLLTGSIAYKIKKPVNLGFLDFSTIEKRYQYCQEELRLNKRYSPDIYLAVIAITGTYENPKLNSNIDCGAINIDKTDRDVIDYAVKMKQFSADSELTHAIEGKHLNSSHIDKLAELIADFHKKIAISTTFDPGKNIFPEQNSTLDTIEILLNNISDKNSLDRVIAIKNWINRSFDKNNAFFRQRHMQGFIRECHGDLHLNNIALVDDNIILFDGIEFSESLRWIDVISEIAFLIMDLQHNNLNNMAYRFLNDYLEITGDYQGLILLNYYLVYRAIVRAMVAALRSNQVDVSNAEKKALKNECDSYISLAESYIQDSKPALMICHGLSASGKSTISQTILENLPAIRIRSDVERKRLYGLGKHQHTKSGLGENIYKPDATIKTYDRLNEFSDILLKNGHNVIVDATFLSQKQRDLFRNTANVNKCKFVILDFIAPAKVLRERIKKRNENKHEVSEADINILENQIKNQIPLDKDELVVTLKIDTQIPFNLPLFKKEFSHFIA